MQPTNVACYKSFAMNLHKMPQLIANRLVMFSTICKFIKKAPIGGLQKKIIYLIPASAI